MCREEKNFYKPNMFQLQCLKILEEQMEKGKYNEAEIGRRLGVNRSTISRCLKKYREQQFLLPQGDGFTKMGRELLHYYKRIEKELYRYFASMDLDKKQQEQAVSGLFDTVDMEIIQKICRKEKMHLQYEKIDENKGKEICKISWDQMGDYIKEGIWRVDFSVYRQGKDWRQLSMADEGFQKPAKLVWTKEEKYLELRIQEMQARTKGGMVLSGYIKTIKCRSKGDRLKNFPIQEGKICIPLEEFEFEDFSGETVVGQVQLIMTSSVGEKRMPESMATLIIRF